MGLFLWGIKWPDHEVHFDLLTRYSVQLYIHAPYAPSLSGALRKRFGILVNFPLLFSVPVGSDHEFMYLCKEET
jgi:hypothetical protein